MKIILKKTLSRSHGKNTASIFAAVLAAVFCLCMWCSCGKPEAVQEIQAKSPRIISLSPAVTETLFQMGLGNHLIGRSDACNVPEEALKLPVAGHFADPNVETILTMKPDFVMTNDLINPAMAKTFEKAGIETLMLPGRSVQDYLSSVETIGNKMQCSEAAEAEKKRVNTILDELKAKPEIQKNVLFIIWNDPLMAAGKGSLPDEILKLAGVRNICENVETEYFRCSQEWLLEQKIDAVVSAHAFTEKDFKGKIPGTARLILCEDESAILRPGPRLAEEILKLRNKLEQGNK